MCQGIAPLVRRFGYDTFLLANTVLVGAAIMSFAAIQGFEMVPAMAAGSIINPDCSGV